MLRTPISPPRLYPRGKKRPSSRRASLVAAFRIPDEDRYIRLQAYDPHRMLNGLADGEPDGYTCVTIDCFSGRSIAAKRALYRAIAERLETLGIPRGLVSILLRESPPGELGISATPRQRRRSALRHQPLTTPGTPLHPTFRERATP
ncbi:MAG: tautomerase family protein [Dermatophilaceae bacterium]